MEGQAGGQSFDRAALLDMVEGDLTLLRQLINILLAETPPLLAELRKAVARRDARRIAALAHRLRGSVANFQALPAVAVARQLEEMAGQGQLLEVDTVMANLERSLADLLDGLERLSA